ncbi:hypothetical protein ACFX13_011911 [Malus domestica]
MFAIYKLQYEKGRAAVGVGGALPKFGEWDVNDPASAEGFTVIFNKARDDRKSGGTPLIIAAAAPEKYASRKKSGKYNKLPKKSKWLICCGC